MSKELKFSEKICVQQVQEIHMKNFISRIFVVKHPSDFMLNLDVQNLTECHNQPAKSIHHSLFAV